MRWTRSILFALPALPLLVAEGGQEPKPAVAVLRFDNHTGDPEYDHLGRAMAGMLISDLSVLEGIRLVERDRLEDIVKELELQQSALVDPATAGKVGRIVGADYVVLGAFVAVDPEMRLDGRIARAETAEIVATAEARGHRDRFFELQEGLADQVVEGLRLVLSEEDRRRLEARQQANRLPDLETAKAFSQALCLLDHGAYVQAFDAIQKVRERAPASALVALTFQALKEKAEEEAKNRAADQVNRAIGRIIGRPRPAPPAPPPSPC